MLPVTGCGGDSAATSGGVLLPDVVPAGPTDLSIQLTPDGHRLLRFEVDMVNRGRGPVEITPVAGQDCDGDGDPANDRALVQVLYVDARTAGPERPAGCSHFHPGHNHWHVDDFAAYRLVRPDGGVSVAEDKVTFCLHDVRRAEPGRGGPAQERYQDCTSDATQGLSVGWSDDYYAQLDGQALDITSVPDGDYTLVAVANAAGLIQESDASNNTAVVPVRLEGAHATVIAALPPPRTRIRGRDRLWL